MGQSANQKVEARRALDEGRAGLSVAPGECPPLSTLITACLHSTWHGHGAPHRVFKGGEERVGGTSNDGGGTSHGKAPARPRLEFRWKALDEWKSAFNEPLKKAIDVYLDNGALEPVVFGKTIPQKKIPPSRFDGNATLEEAELKAHWVIT